jgi:hypothetical protein
MTKPISQIASDIHKDWKKVHFGAAPYLRAMLLLDSPTDKYGLDDAKSIIRYFLVNSNGWRGDTAKAIKAELRELIK